MNCRIKNTYSLIERILYIPGVDVYIVTRYDKTTHHITKSEVKRLAKSFNLKYVPSAIGSSWGYYR